MDSLEKNRLLLAIEREMRHYNQECINPEIPELTIEKLAPVLKLVARSRAAYLKELFDLGVAVSDGLPAAEQLQNLTHLRETYRELVEGAKALEIAIERGYVDVGPG